LIIWVSLDDFTSEQCLLQRSNRNVSLQTDDSSVPRQAVTFSTDVIMDEAQTE
jgi:hypothetical protein